MWFACTSKEKLLGISNTEPRALCVVQNEKKIQFLSSKILPHRATVSTFVCKAVCTILAFLFPKIGKSKKCRPLYQPPQGSYVQVFKYKILIRNWEQKVLLQTIAHNKMKSYSVYLRRKFRFKEQPTCSSSVFFLCL